VADHGAVGVGLRHVGCGELRESIDVLLDVDAYTKADNRAFHFR